MAEKPRRQTQTLVCRTEQAAVGLAYEKLYDKQAGGYTVAYAD
jgi:hypothetical protein